MNDIKIGRHLAFSFMVPFLQVLKKEIVRGVFRTLSNAYDEISLSEVFNVFQPFTFSRKSSAIAVRHNPKYASDILVRFSLHTS